MQQNAGLLVLVAHNGKQIHLDVQPSTRFVSRVLPSCKSARIVTFDSVRFPLPRAHLGLVNPSKKETDVYIATQTHTTDASHRMDAFRPLVFLPCDIMPFILSAPEHNTLVFNTSPAVNCPGWASGRFQKVVQETAHVQMGTQQITAPANSRCPPFHLRHP